LAESTAFISGYPLSDGGHDRLALDDAGYRQGVFRFDFVNQPFCFAKVSDFDRFRLF
jgi:hypothetical protein